MQWLLLRLLGWLKLTPEAFEAWCESKGWYIGITPVYLISAGSRGTKNGLPHTLDEPKYFKKRIWGPTQRYGYREGAALYVFHEECVAYHGRLIRLWGREIWLDDQSNEAKS